MKKLLSVFLVFMMLLTSVSVMAQTTSENGIELSELERDKISLLYSMGIIESEDITKNEVTRGEFASWLANLLCIDNISSASSAFSDVDAKSPYAGAIAAVSAMGYMNGISETEFGINKNISVQDATVSIVRLLGYEPVAQKNGGYPGGYIRVASTTNLYKQVNADGRSNRVVIMQLCYNAMTVPYVDYNGTRLSDNIILESVHGVVKNTGVVTGNRFTKLRTEKIEISANEIEIDGKLYTTEDVSFAEYLGERVKYYYILEDGERRLIDLKPESDRDEILTVDAKDIVSINGNSLTYKTADDEIEEIDLVPGYDFVVNNRVVLSRAELSIDDITDGSFIFIDSDEDEKYDIVKAKRIETMTFNSVDDLEARIYCKEGQIYTNLYDEKYYFKVIRVDEKTGKESTITVDEIVKGDILTVYRSADDKYTLIYAYTSPGVKGIIEEMGEDYVVINGVAYDLPLNTPIEELVCGNNVNFSTDMFGRLVNLEESTSIDGPIYGYFFAYEEPKGLESGKVKILDGEAKHVFNLAEKIKINDATTYTSANFSSCATLFSGSTAIRQLIKYDLNNAGEISNIYTVGGGARDSIKESAVANDTAIRRYPWYDIWDGKYIRTGNTFLMVIPDYSDEERANEELYTSTYRGKNSEHDVYCDIYDVDEETMEAGVILVYSKDPLDTPAETGMDTNVGVVISKTVGAEGPVIRINTNGVTEKYEVNTQYVDVTPYEPGDVVRYVQGADGKINTLVMVLNVGTTGLNTPVPEFYEDGDCKHYFARVYNNLGNFLVLVPNQDNPTFDDSIANRITVPINDVANCIVVNMAGQSVKAYPGTASAISNYIDGTDGGTYYVYARVYKFYSFYDLIIYKF